LLDDGVTFGCSCNRDAAPASELEQSLVAEQPQRPQHGVCVDAEDCGEIPGGREALSLLGFSFGDRPSNLGGDLFVEIGGVALIDLNMEYGASNISATELGTHP
jgi:hypothetical protein